MDKLLEIEYLIVSEKFRTKIGMYIGEKNIHILKGFLDGIEYAKNSYEIEAQSEYFLEGFHDFVAMNYNWHSSTAGWKNIILKEPENDPVASVDEFVIERKKTH